MSEQGLTGDQSGLSVDRAMHAIIDAAMQGGIQPGDRLRENDLGRAWQMSRVPVREAIRRLEASGVIVRHPFRGATLMDVTNDSVAELMRVRRALEQLALRDAIAALGAGAAARPLREALLRGATLGEPPNRVAQVQADLALHGAIVVLGGNAALYDLWSGIARRLAVVWGVGHDCRPWALTQAEHAALIEAILALDEPAAAQRLDAHLRWAAGCDFDALVSEQRRQPRGQAAQPA